MKIVVQFLAVILLFCSCSNQFGKVLKSKDNEYKYKMAEQYYAQKKWDKAAQLFEQLFPYVKGTARFEDLYYKYAYCAYYQRDYLNAENLFKNYLESFPNSQRAEEVEFMRAFCFFKQSPKVDLDQTSTSKAIALLQAFINTHPGSERNKEAENLINQLRSKLETKELKAAQLYYNLGYYKAAAVAFSTLMDDYPASDQSDSYKLEVIKSDYKYAQMSIPEKQQERYQQVLTDVADFEDRFPQSNLLPQVQDYKTQSTNNIKRIQDEQAKATTRQ
ncbi:outer membrane protein assembly factor BamD [Ilyomonas limi]|uniref:Outer membrane protein assembly factor BamD n=1 Tax=Ilyomonas limi TaxID=2575867 RepID=A0A4U3L2P1_9BACT|nr:outer membrane protein assembly factor BamD [Ilyomonas limi]TKK67797.1 outer membrane protein assembly factor BamD [Ilyomonas limi]